MFNSGPDRFSHSFYWDCNARPAPRQILLKFVRNNWFKHRGFPESRYQWKIVSLANTHVGTYPWFNKVQRKKSRERLNRYFSSNTSNFVFVESFHSVRIYFHEYCATFLRIILAIRRDFYFSELRLFLQPRVRVHARVRIQARVYT